jgi:hypothetical protein
MCILAPFAALLLIGGLQHGEIAFIVIGGMLSLVALIGIPSMIWDLFASPRGGYGQCPVCSNSIEAQSGDHQNLLCAGCGTYLDAKIDRLETIEPGRTTDKPFFAAPTPWPEVRRVVSSTIAFSAFDYAQDKLTELMMKKAGVKFLNATWPPGCCVCGRPATRKDRYVLPVILAGQIRDTKATLIANDVPYCTEHKDGIAFERVSFNSLGAESSYGILFRSHEYREAFRKLNNWTWAGLVPKPPGKPPASPASGDKVIVRCNNCSQQIRVPSGKDGTIKCPSCGQAFKAAT